MKLLKKLIIAVVVVITVLLIAGVSFFTYILFIHPRLQFPYAKDSLLIWKLDDPGHSTLSSNWNVTVDSQKNLVISVVNLHGDPVVQNTLLVENCKQDYAHSCIVFLNADTGQFIHSLIIDGDSDSIADTKNDLYVANELTENWNGKDGVKILKVNKETYEVTTVWEKDGENSGINKLKVTGNYLLFEERISSLESPLGHTVLHILDTTKDLPTDDIELNEHYSSDIINTKDGRENVIKIFNEDSKIELVYDMKKKKLLESNILSPFEAYKYLHTTTVSPDGLIVYYTESVRVGAMDKNSKVLWEANLRPKELEGERVAKIDDKLYVDEKNVYVATQSREFYALDKDTGKVNWVTALPTSVGKDFVVYKNKAYFGLFGDTISPSGLGVIDLATGKLVHLELPEGASTYWMDIAPLLSPPYIYLLNDYSGLYKFKLLD